MATYSIIKKGGGFYGEDMEEKEMDTKNVTRIVKIRIDHSNYRIEGLTVYFQRIDENHYITQCTDRWGGPSDTMTEVNLKPKEYITSVNGTVIRYSDVICYVSSLVLKTNLNDYGPYGRQHGESFNLAAPLDDQIIGFHGYCTKDWVNALGVYVRQSDDIIKKGPFLCGNSKVKHMDPTGITRIVKISIYQSDKIHGLTVYFERYGTTQCTDLWGRKVGMLNEVNLTTNEYITSVNGYVDRYSDICYVRSLVLKTNLGVYGPYGKEEGEPFEFPALGGQIIGFHAHCSKDLVNALGVYVRQLNGTIIKKGPFLVGGYRVKYMDPAGFTRIVNISIYHSDKINGLNVHFERNGTTQCTGLWG